jgi:hypothetical protein
MGRLRRLSPTSTGSRRRRRQCGARLRECEKRSRTAPPDRPLRRRVDEGSAGSRPTG